MRAISFLLIYSFKRVRTLVLATAILLAFFQIVLILVARSIQASNAFGELATLFPPFIRELMGPSLIGMMSFRGMVCVGYFDVPIIAALVALSVALATVPTSEIETGFMDLILARPMARHWIVTRSIIVVTACTVTLLVVMLTATWAGLDALAPKDAAGPTPTLIFSLAANLGLLTLAWGGIAMAIGAASRRRGAAGAVTGWLALAAFLLDYIGHAWKPAEPWSKLSPFHYYRPFELLSGAALSATDLAVLAGIAAAGFAVAYVLFSRRDITH